MKKLVLLFISLISFISLLNAQNPQWIVYSTDGHRIMALVEEGGFVWAATDGGLVRIDKTTGVSVFYNTINSGLPDNKISSIAIDSNGIKWIGTYEGGLMKFDGLNWTIYNTMNSGLPGDMISSIAIDENGVKWIGTEYGLARFNGINWTIYNSLNSGLPGDEISSISIEENGILWMGLNGKD